MLQLIINLVKPGYISGGERGGSGNRLLVCPDPAKIQAFLKHHPRQDVNNPVVKKVFTSRGGMVRQWLTYCNKRHTLFCFVCLAFSKATDSSSFVTGMSDWRHVHQRVEEHEKSMAHRNCAEAYFLKCS